MAINAPDPVETNAHALHYDFLHHELPGATDKGAERHVGIESTVMTTSNNYTDDLPTLDHRHKHPVLRSVPFAR